jgi:hypothetical protein
MSNPVDPSQSLIQLENKKFRQGVGPDDIGVKVFGEFAPSSAGHPLDSIVWDSYVTSETSTTDTIEYYQGGVTGTLVITFTAIYSDFRKKNLISGAWVTP